MTNADKYLKDGVDVEEFVKEFCKVEQFEENAIMPNCIREFLNTPLKPTLTEDEKVILRNINKQYVTITREEDKQIIVWTETGWNTTIPYEHLFQFIQQRRRI